MTEETSNISGDCCFSVCIDEYEESTERVVQCIDELQTRNFPDPDRFSIRGCFTNEIADALQRAFDSFVTRGIQWRRLNLYLRRDSEIEPRRLGDAMRVAN